MKKIRTVTLTLLLFFLALLFTTNVQAKEKTYVVGLDDTFAPFGFRDGNGNIVGFDIDLAKSVAKREGLNFKFQAIDWELKETELNSGEIDMIWNGYGITPERQEQVDFTDPYLEEGMLVVTLANSPIKKMEDLKGVKMATQSGSTAFEDMKKWPNDLYNKLNGEVVLYPSYDQVFADLDSGRVQAIYGNAPYLQYVMKQRGSDKYAYFEDKSTPPEKMAVGVKKGNDDLVQKLNDGLEKIKEDGTYDKIKEKWFSQESQRKSGWQLLTEILPSLARGARSTFILFLSVVLLSLPIGFLLGILRSFGPKPLQPLLSAYIFIMRGSPLMLQLMVVFFGLPYIGLSMGRFSAALFAFVINYAAYLAEIFRGGILSVPKDQYESIDVLGIGKLRGFLRIILPQVGRITLPSLANEIINLVKDTSLVYVIGLGELLRSGSIAANAYASLMPYLFVGVIYLAFTAVLTYILNRLEKGMSW